MALNIPLTEIPNLDVIYQKPKRGGVLSQLTELQDMSIAGNQFILTVDAAEASLVGEGGAKSESGDTASTIVVAPHKFEYSRRVSDEFYYLLEGNVDLNNTEAVVAAIADSPYHMGIIEDFFAAAQKKLARAFDIACFHGVDPRSGTASSLIGTENFDDKVTNTVTITAGKEYEDLLTAIGKSEDNTNATGIAGDISLKTALRAINGDLSNPRQVTYDNIDGLPTVYSNTVKFGSSKDVAIVGDFAGSLVAGYVPQFLNNVRVLVAGNPDNSSTGDLAAHNQVLLRIETVFGWNIFAPENFARLEEASEA